MVYLYFLLGDSEHTFSLSSWTGVFSSGFASVSLIGLIFPGEIFSGLSFFSLNSLLAGGGFFSVLSGDLCVSFVWKAVSCLILFLDDSALCWFFFVGVGFCFLGVFFAALFLPVFLQPSFAWFRLKQLAIKKGVGLHLNSPLIGISLQGNSSTINWSRYRLFKFGRTVPSEPLYETLFRYTFNFLRRRSSAKNKEKKYYIRPTVWWWIESSSGWCSSLVWFFNHYNLPRKHFESMLKTTVKLTKAITDFLWHYLMIIWRLIYRFHLEITLNERGLDWLDVWNNGYKYVL